MAALTSATRDVLKSTGVDGRDVAAIALDTTGSSVIPVGEGPANPAGRVLPVVRSSRVCRGPGNYAKAHAMGLEAIEWCGGVYSLEWGFSKLLHWLRHNPGQARQVGDGAGALRHGGGDAMRR